MPVYKQLKTFVSMSWLPRIPGHI